MNGFDHLLSPITVADFGRDYLGKMPLHIPADGDAVRREVLNWEAFNSLLGQQSVWTAETLRLVNNRKAVPPAEYCRQEPSATGPVQRPSGEKVQLHLATGASLVANEVQSLHRPIANVATILSRTFAAKVGANVYCSFRGVQAFGAHFDNHDVFAIQTEGEKRWRIYESQVEMPVDLPPDTPETRKWLEGARGRLLEEVVTRPGDLLYIPRGRFHEAIAIDDASLHVTFSVTALYGRILFSLLDNAAMQFPAFRRYFPPAWEGDGQALREHLAELSRLLADLTASPAFLEEVAMAQERLVPRTSVSSLPHRLSLTHYRATGRPFPHAEPGALVAYEWCQAQGHFSLEDLLVEIDFVHPDRLRQAITAAEAAGAVEKAGFGS